MNDFLDEQLRVTVRQARLKRLPAFGLRAAQGKQQEQEKEEGGLGSGFQQQQQQAQEQRLLGALARSDGGGSSNSSSSGSGTAARQLLSWVDEPAYPPAGLRWQPGSALGRGPGTARAGHTAAAAAGGEGRHRRGHARPLRQRQQQQQRLREEAQAGEGPWPRQRRLQWSSEEVAKKVRESRNAWGSDLTPQELADEARAVGGWPGGRVSTSFRHAGLALPLCQMALQRCFVCR